LVRKREIWVNPLKENGTDHRKNIGGKYGANEAHGSFKEEKNPHTVSF